MSPGEQAKEAGRANSVEPRPRRGSKEFAAPQPTLADVLNAVNGLRDDNAKALAEIAATNGRVSKVEERVAEVEKATADLEVKMDQVDLEIDNKIEKKVEEKMNGLIEQNLNTYVENKVKQAVEEAMKEKFPEPKKSQKGNQPDYSFRVPVSEKVKQILPKPRDKADKRVQMAFQDLLASAEGQKRTFVVGMKDEKDAEGKTILPEVPFKTIFKSFFRGIRYKQDEPTTAASNKLPIIRFVVHPDDVHQTKMIIRERGREMRLLGWWAAQESPKDLRDMESNAVKFFVEAKNICKDLKRVWLQAEDGFVKAASVPILPVFSIPKDKTKWPLLAPILLKMVEDIRDQDWLSRQKKPKAVNPMLYEQWGDITDPPEAAAVESSDGEDSDESEASDEDSSSGEEEEKKGRGESTAATGENQDEVMKDLGS
jgi:hypothetical protein